MQKTYLNNAYGTKDTNSTRKLYDDWAASYDAEIAENGYATPGRCAAALAQFTQDQNAPVLDFGCGTGLSGLALKLAGFSVIDGLDLSPEMLAKARDKGIYRRLAVSPVPRRNGICVLSGMVCIVDRVDHDGPQRRTKHRSLFYRCQSIVPPVAPHGYREQNSRTRHNAVPFACAQTPRHHIDISE